MRVWTRRWPLSPCTCNVFNPVTCVSLHLYTTHAQTPMYFLVLIFASYFHALRRFLDLLGGTVVVSSPAVVPSDTLVLATAGAGGGSTGLG